MPRARPGQERQELALQGRDHLRGDAVDRRQAAIRILHPHGGDDGVREFSISINVLYFDLFFSVVKEYCKIIKI